MRWYVLGAAVLFGLGASAAHAGQGGAKPTPAPTSVPSSVPTSAPTAVASPAATAVPTSKTASTGTDGQAAVVSGPAGNTMSAAFRPAHRSPVVATLLAWIPGVVVHGSGHMYAHSWMTGLGLFALEGASVYLVYDGYHEYQRGSFNNLLNTNSGNSGLPTNLGYEYQEAGVGLVALGAFIFTWVDDICGASIAAKQFNQLQEQQAQTISMHLEPRPGGAVLALSSNF